jgi:hypothetical protein
VGWETYNFFPGIFGDERRSVVATSLHLVSKNTGPPGTIRGNKFFLRSKIGLTDWASGAANVMLSDQVRRKK